MKIIIKKKIKSVINGALVVNTITQEGNGVMKVEIGAKAGLPCDLLTSLIDFINSLRSMPLSDLLDLLGIIKTQDLLNLLEVNDNATLNQLLENSGVSISKLLDMLGKNYDPIKDLLNLNKVLKIFKFSDVLELDIDKTLDLLEVTNNTKLLNLIGLTDLTDLIDKLGLLGCGTGPSSLLTYDIIDYRTN